MDIKPSGERRAEEELFIAKVDRIMAEESVILEGLKAAVWSGEITEDEKQEWLNEYISKRNALSSLPDNIETSPSPPRKL